MAGFATHVSGGIAVGAIMAAAGHYYKDLSLVQTGAVFVVGAVGGLLPDLDSDTGKPVTLLFSVLSVMVPSIFLPQFVQLFGSAPELIICYFTISYLIINYGVCGIIKRLTIHRGMMHSIPFAVLAGAVCFWLFMDYGLDMAFFAASAVFLGSMVHLILDEFNSITLKFGIIPMLKTSSGTALKLRSNNMGVTVLYYFFIIIVFAVILMRI